jgi:hypothetical protein
MLAPLALPEVEYKLAASPHATKMHTMDMEVTWA